MAYELIPDPGFDPETGESTGLAPSAQRAMEPARTEGSYELIPDPGFDPETGVSPGPSAIDEAGKGFARGFLGMAESVGTGLRYLGGKTGFEGMTDLGESVEEHWSNVRDKYAMDRRLHGSVMDSPELLKSGAWWAANVAEIVPSFAASVIPGMGISKAVMGATKIAKLARISGALGGGGVGGSLEGANTYREVYDAVIRRGGSEAEASSAAETSAEAMTVASGLLNTLSVDRFLKGLPDTFKGRMVARTVRGTVEAVTEWAESPAESASIYLAGEEMTIEEAIQGMKDEVNVLGPAFLVGLIFPGAGNIPSQSGDRGAPPPSGEPTQLTPEQQAFAASPEAVDEFVSEQPTREPGPAVVNLGPVDDLAWSEGERQVEGFVNEPYNPVVTEQQIYPERGPVTEMPKPPPVTPYTPENATEAAVDEFVAEPYTRRPEQPKSALQQAAEGTLEADEVISAQNTPSALQQVAEGTLPKTVPPRDDDGEDGGGAPVAPPLRPEMAQSAEDVAQVEEAPQTANVAAEEAAPAEEAKASPAEAPIGSREHSDFVIEKAKTSTQTHPEVQQSLGRWAKTGATKEVNEITSRAEYPAYQKSLHEGLSQSYPDGMVPVSGLPEKKVLTKYQSVVLGPGEQEVQGYVPISDVVAVAPGSRRVILSGKTKIAPVTQGAPQESPRATQAGVVPAAKAAQAPGPTAIAEPSTAIAEEATAETVDEAPLSAGDRESVAAVAKKEGISEGAAETLVKRLRDREARAKKRLKDLEKAGQGTLFDVTGALIHEAKTVAAWADIGATKLAIGGLSYARWQSQMIQEFGKSIKPHLKKVYLKAKKVLAGERKTVKETEYARTKSGKLLGVPEWVKTNEDLVKLRLWLKRLVEEGKAGRYWYEKSSEHILRIAGNDHKLAEKIAMLVAIYSPQNTIAPNMQQALQAYYHWRAGLPAETLNVRAFGAEHNNPDTKAVDILYNGKDYDGRKTNSFFGNLMVEINRKLGKPSPDVITNDMWVARAMGYDSDSYGTTKMEGESRDKYQFSENMQKALAEEYGWTGHQIQAAIWTAIKARHEHKLVKRMTNLESVKNGWSHFEQRDGKEVWIAPPEGTEAWKSHRKLWMRNAWGLGIGQSNPFGQVPKAIREEKLTKEDTDTAAFDFSDALGLQYGSLSWESRPHESYGFEDFNNATWEELKEYHAEVAQALRPLAKKLGLLSTGHFGAAGEYTDDAGVTQVNPAQYVRFITPKKKGQLTHELEMDPASELLVQQYAAIVGFVTRQQGVGYHRPHYRARVMDQNGQELSLGRRANRMDMYQFRGEMKVVESQVAYGKALFEQGNATPAKFRDHMVEKFGEGVRPLLLQLRSLSKALHEGSSAPDTYLAAYEGGLRIISLTTTPRTAEEGGKLSDSGRSADNLKRKREIKLFHGMVKLASQAFAKKGSDAELRGFGSYGNLVSGGTDGQSYIQRFQEANGPASVQRWVRDVLAPRIDDINRNYASRRRGGQKGTGRKVREIPALPDFTRGGRSYNEQEGSLAAPVPLDRLDGGRQSQENIYGRYGTLGTRDTTQDSKIYALEPIIADQSRTDQLLEQAGFKLKYFSFHVDEEAGVDYVIPRLKKEGYQQNTLWIYDPRVADGSFKDVEYTRAWRVSHELGHAITEAIVAKKGYGNSKRYGRLGREMQGERGKPPKTVSVTLEPLTLKQAQRAVEWEDLAFRAQRLILERLGITINEQEFAKEYNINIADASFRVLTGDFGNPGEYGFVPGSEKADLRGTLEMLAATEAELAREQGRKATKGIPLSSWAPVSDAEIESVVESALGGQYKETGPPSFSRVDTISVPRGAGTAGLSISQVEEAISRVIERWKGAPEVRVVETVKGLPEGIQSRAGDSAQGVYVDGVVYLVASKLYSARHARTVLAHEVVGHHSMEEMLGTEYDGLVREIHKLDLAKNKKLAAVKREVRERYGRLSQKEEAQEIIAVMAERHVRDGKLGGIMRKVRRAIRSFLRRMGFNLTLSDSDIDTLITIAEQRLEAPFIRRPSGLRKGALRSEPAPAFYSQLQRTLDERLQPKGTAASHLKTIEKLEKQGLFKQEEIEWSGLKEWLSGKASNNAPITKEDIANFLLGNELVIEEREGSQRYADYMEPGYEEYDEILYRIKDVNDEDYKHAHWPGEKNILAFIRSTRRLMANGQAVLSLDEIQSDWHQQGRKTGYKSRAASMVAYLNARDDAIEAMRKIVGEDGKRHSYRGASRYISLVVWQANKAIEDNYGIEGLLNRRPGADFEQLTLEKLLKVTETALDKNVERGVLDENSKNKILDVVRISYLNHPHGPESNKIPDAPMKKGWSLHVIKRNIRRAAEEGYDVLTWPTGEVVANRYPEAFPEVGAIQLDPLGENLILLSPHGEHVYETGVDDIDGLPKDIQEMAQRLINSAEYETSEWDSGIVRVGDTDIELKYEDEVNQFVIYDPNGEVVRSFGGDPILFSSWEDASEFIRTQLDSERLTEVLDEPRKIGADWAYNLYDRQLVNEVNKYLKKWGVKARKVKVSSGSAVGTETYEKNGSTFSRPAIVHRFDLEHWAIDITPEMRESVLEAGQPLFSREHTPDVQAAMQKINPRSPNAPILARAKVMLADLKKSWHQGIIDQYDSLKALSPQAWMMAHMSKSASGAVEGLLMYGKVRLDASGALTLDDVDEGIIKKLAPLGAELNDFFGWMAGNRAESLKGQDRERLFTDDDIVALKTLNQGEMANGRNRAEVYEAARAALQEYNNSVLDIAVEAGTINAEERSTWENDFYVPFFRLMDNENVRGPANLQQLSNQTAYKKLKGADVPVADLLGNTMMNWNKLVDSSLKNIAATKALEGAVEMGIATEIEASQRGKDSIFIRRDGKQVWYDVSDPMVMQSLTALNWDGFNNPAMKTLRNFKRWFTIGVTASPEFRVANLIRDSIHSIAVGNISYNILDNVLNKGWKGTKEGSLNRAQMLVGGGEIHFGHNYGADPEGARKIIQGKLNRHFILDNEKAWEGFGRHVKKLWNTWQEVGSRAENINRAAAFQYNLAQGRSLLEANFEARDLMDFSRHGAWASVRFLIQVVPFLNARIQGLDKAGRAAMNPATRARFATVVSMYALAAAMLYLAFKDDPDYDEREEWDKDSYLWFKLPGSETAYRIPKPFEVGAIGTIAERLTQQMVDDEAHGPLFAERMWHMLKETFAFSVVPHFFHPMLEVYANKNSFTKRPIESMGMERLSPVERKQAWTSQTAVGLSTAMDKISWGKVVLSPLQIEHLLEGWFGWIGASSMASVDMAIRHASGHPERPAMRMDQYTLIGRFVREDKPPRSTKYMTLFYDQLKEMERAYGDYRNALKLNQPDRARSIMEENRELLGWRKGYSRAQRKLSKINQRIKLIWWDPRMTAEMKEAAINDLYRHRNAITEQMVRAREVRAARG